MNRAQIYAAINAERARQQQLWGGEHLWGQGDCSSNAVAPIVKVAVLTEEVGEVARAVMSDETTDSLGAELVQVAAVAVAWLESLPNIKGESTNEIGPHLAGSAVSTLPADDT